MQNFDKLSNALVAVFGVKVDIYQTSTGVVWCHYPSNAVESQLTEARNIINGWTDFTPYRRWGTKELKEGIISKSRLAQFKALLSTPLKNLDPVKYPDPTALVSDLYEEVTVLNEAEYLWSVLYPNLPALLNLTNQEITDILNQAEIK